MRSSIILGVPLFLVSYLLLAQGPVSDRVMVTFDNPVAVAKTVLSPGDYTIRQTSTANNPRVLEFSSDKGTTLEVTTTAIPTLDNHAADSTKVVLENQNGIQHLSKIWIEGKNYGYAFPMEEVPAGTYAQNGQAGQTLEMTATYHPAETQTETAQATPPPAPAPAAEPQQPQQKEPEQQQEIAQAQPPAQTAPAEPQPAPANQNENQGQIQSNQTEPTTPEMPQTASEWPASLAIGLLMIGAGTLLRRVTA